MSDKNQYKKSFKVSNQVKNNNNKMTETRYMKTKKTNQQT